MRFLHFFFLLSTFSYSQELKIEKTKTQYLALGDSYTIGESVDEKYSWPIQLKFNLFNSDSNTSLDSVRIIAKTGWTTSDLLNYISNIKINNNYDLVSLLIGVNNQFRGYDKNIYEKEFEKLLIKSIGFANSNFSNVFVLSIPDYGVTPFGKLRDSEKIKSEINLYNEINYKISKKYGVLYFDITDISRLAEFDSTLLADDMLHPSKKMYNLWVEKIVDQVINQLSH
ncbi:MAG: GDSL-type esterase/lipase family protein [Bacteroidota bacterium]|nr:GDSL-type esterase/lipase family protein [Bacteroidota bacterium]